MSLSTKKENNLMVKTQKELQNATLVDNDSNLTNKGIKYNRAFYDSAIKNGMICRCATIKSNPKTGKKIYMYCEPFYKDSNKYDKCLNLYSKKFNVTIISKII